MMGKVVLWLHVYEHHHMPGYQFPDELWSKELDMAHAPDVGDEIFLWQDRDDCSGVMVGVKNRYWDHDGTLNLELRSIVHLPNDKWEFDNKQAIAAHIRDDADCFLRHCPMPWRDYDDEDVSLNMRLRGGDWLTWKERREQDGQVSAADEGQES
jgi:hypothetical protein